ncbi:type II secretion system F family protein [Micromonospora sp. NPDC050397]|uniref:type II secretion system F family protein n=1 Tax=Micromonospora sp. NPDC050397 TaxID=3364279 RepID=UPI00384F50FD
MTSGWWLVGACLLGSAVVVAWSPTASRSRWRAVVDGPAQAARPARRAGLGWLAGTDSRVPVLDRVATGPKRAVLVVAGVTALAGAVLGGPVAAVAGLAYGGLAAKAALRRHSVRAAVRVRRRQLDGLSALAADLRAGLPVRPAVGGTAEPPPAGAAMSGSSSDRAAVPVTSPDPSERIDRLIGAAVRLAEQTGAPLADLLERIEADARAMDRGLAAAAAQAAGARATAMLLAGLPLGGIALGYGIGVDPLAVLLRTPIGAACAVGAIVLQLAGLAWSDRLSTSALRAA